MLAAVDIDEIVRAVLRQLHGEAQLPEKEQKVESRAPAGLSSSAAAARTLELTEKLVTLATLENRLDGVKRLALRAGAVVTPAAIDELRGRGITIERIAAKSPAKPAQATLILGVAEVAEQACDVSALIAAMVATGGAIERLARSGLTSVTAELAEHAALGGRPTLLLTSRPAAAVCLANRRRGVRAVGGRDARGVLEAIQEVAANFVAINPVALSAFELRRIVDEYCGHWPRPLPNEMD